MCIHIAKFKMIVNTDATMNTKNFAVLPMKKQAERLLDDSAGQKMTEIQLASYMNFTTNEIDQLKLFWQPVFNESFIYLSDELILGNLTSHTGKNALSRFYTTVNNFENYQEGIDYIKLNINDKLVQDYYTSFDSPVMGESKELHKMHAKKLFGVSGELWKELLMQAQTEQGAQTRKLYLKIEKMAKLMLYYNGLLTEKQLQLENKKLLEHTKNTQRIINDAQNKAFHYEFELNIERKKRQDAEEEANRRQKEVEDEKIKSRIIQLKAKFAGLKEDPEEFYAEDEYVYIEASPHEYRSIVIGFGRTIELHGRLSTYQTKRVDENLSQYLKVWKVWNSTFFESFVKTFLFPYANEQAKKKLKIKSAANIQACIGRVEVFDLPATCMIKLIDLMVKYYRRVIHGMKQFAHSDELITEVVEIVDEADAEIASRPTDKPTVERTLASYKPVDINNLNLSLRSKFPLLDLSNLTTSLQDNDIKIKLIKEVSACINEIYDSPDPPCVHDVEREFEPFKFVLPMTYFRNYLKEFSNYNVQMTEQDIAKWNKQMRDFLLTEHKQIDARIKKPPNWAELVAPVPKEPPADPDDELDDNFNEDSDDSDDETVESKERADIEVPTARSSSSSSSASGSVDRFKWLRDLNLDPKLYLCLEGKKYDLFYLQNEFVLTHLTAIRFENSEAYYFYRTLKEKQDEFIEYQSDDEPWDFAVETKDHKLMRRFIAKYSELDKCPKSKIHMIIKHSAFKRILLKANTATGRKAREYFTS